MFSFFAAFTLVKSRVLAYQEDPCFFMRGKYIFCGVGGSQLPGERKKNDNNSTRAMNIRSQDPEFLLSPQESFVVMVVVACCNTT